MNSTAVLTKSSLTVLDDLHTEKLHAWHRERLAVIYTLSRDFVGSNGNLPPHRERRPSLR
jgi:hypothetical protein